MPVLLPKRVHSIFFRWAFRIIGRLSSSTIHYVDRTSTIRPYFLSDANKTQVLALLENMGIKPLSQTRKFQKSIILISNEEAGVVFKQLQNIFDLDFTVILKFIMGGQKFNLRITSGLQLSALNSVVGAAIPVSINIHKLIKSDENSRMFGPDYGVELVRVTQKSGWWLNPVSDTYPPNFHNSYVERLTALTTVDPDFPIDLVYTWVDGSDPGWIERKQTALDPKESVRQSSVSRNRFENRDELLYSLRSALMYAPWMRNIYIITDQQKPTWLDETEHSQIKIIDHSSLFPDAGCLPNFNSHAIESVMHRIAGLSDQFIYLNDDMLFNAPTQPDDFFSAGGLSKAFFSKFKMPMGLANDRSIGSEWGGINASDMLFKRFGRNVVQKIRHSPVGINRETMSSLEKEFKSEFSNLRNTSFRSPSDFSPVLLYLNYAIFSGHGITGNIEYEYIGLGDRNSEKKLAKLGTNPKKVICINDEDMSADSLGWERRENMVKNFFDFQYPWRAPWEKIN